MTAKDWDKFGRRVNKGAKGIPQLVRVNGYYNVGSIFDVSMTYGNKPYPIPEIKPEQMDKAIKELERFPRSTSYFKMRRCRVRCRATRDCVPNGHAAA